MPYSLDLNCRASKRVLLQGMMVISMQCPIDVIALTARSMLFIANRLAYKLLQVIFLPFTLIRL